MADTKIICSCCGKHKKIASYYTSVSKIYSYLGRLPICKDCLIELVDTENIRSVIDTLRMIDKPFLFQLWESSIKEASKKDSNIFRIYMKNVVMPQHKQKTWNDSELEDDYIEEKEYNNYNLDNEVIERWRGWDEEKMKVLESHYQELINTYEHDTPIQRSIYRNIAVAQMQADDAIANGRSNDYKKYMDVISGLMNDAKIKPLQETAAEDGSLSTWGQWVAKIEEEEPIPEATGEFKDVDGIMKYIQKWFVGHMKRMLGIGDSLSSDKEDDE